MRKLRLYQHPRVKTSATGLKRAFLQTLGVVVRRRRVVAVLAAVCVIASFSLPATAPGGIDEIIAAIEQVFTDTVNGLLGNQFEPRTIHFAYKPPLVDSVHVDVTVIGYAFCNPPDPWAAPDPTPTFPYNVYGCENVETVTADVNSDVTSSDVLITVSDFFLDIEY